MTIDQVRAYWSTRPCNIRHSLIDIDEDPLAFSRQVTARKYRVESHIPGFAHFGRWGGKRVLELGCGIGTDTLEFARNGADVTAIDISETSIEIARKRARAEGLNTKILWGIGNIEDSYRLPDFMNNSKRFRTSSQTEKGWSSFDLVYSFGVIHHTPHPWRVLQEAHRCLKPRVKIGDLIAKGGELRIMLYHRKSWKVLAILVRNWQQFFRGKTIDQIVALESEAQSGCPVTYTYTKKSARKLLESCGFTIESTEVTHIFPYSIPHYIKHEYVKAFPWKIMPDRLFDWFERRVGWHLLITARKV